VLKVLRIPNITKSAVGSLVDPAKSLAAKPGRNRITSTMIGERGLISSDPKWLTMKDRRRCPPFTSLTAPHVGLPHQGRTRTRAEQEPGPNKNQALLVCENPACGKTSNDACNAGANAVCNNGIRAVSRGIVPTHGTQELWTTPSPGMN